MTIGGALGGILGAGLGALGFLSGPALGIPLMLIGFQIGVGIGSFIDPPRMDEPSLQTQDIQYNTFARNLPVPVVYGRCKVAGNCIWIGNTRTEVTERDVEGGKGAPEPPGVREVWYWADFGIALSEGAIGEVESVELDDEDISAKEGINYTAYLGTTTQTADSRVVAALGAAAAPAWRNTAYLAVGGRLGQANRVPTISAVIGGRTTLGSSAVKYGTYVGNGVDARAITGIGFQPVMLWIVRLDTGALVWRTSSMTGDYSLDMPGSAADKTNKIESLDADGFTIGSDNAVNLNGTTYYYIAFQADANLVVGTYTGNGGDDRDISLGTGITWQPTFVMVQNETAGNAAWAWYGAKGGDNSHMMSSTTAWAANNIQGAAITGGSFQVGSAGGVNQDTKVMHYCAFAAAVGKFLTGSYTGNGADNRQITQSDAFFPAFAMTQSNRDAVTVDGGTFLRHRSMAVNECARPGAGGPIGNAIQDAWASGFEVGSHSDVNADTILYYFLSLGGLVAGGTETATLTGDAARNPAWAIRDLLTNVRYGLGLPTSRINEPSFAAAATYCDALVTNPDGTTEKRFMLDYILYGQRPILDHLRDMLATFRGFLVWSGGVVYLRVEKDESVSQSFTMASIVADSFQWRKQSYRDRANVLRIEYINGADKFRHDFAEAFDDWDIDTTGERRERALRLVGITRATQAQRMALFYLDQAIHVAHACAFRVGIGALQAEAGDVIAVSHDVPAWSAKQFRILQIEEAENDELTLICLEHVAGIYHDQGIANQVPGGLVIDTYEIPYQVVRLTAQKQPSESVIELAYTRPVSSDLFAGALLYRRRGSGTFDQVDSTLAVGPSAYLDSQTQSLTQTGTGAPVPSYFSDNFNRADANSLGAGWTELVQTAVWTVRSSAAVRTDPGSGTGDSVARINSFNHYGDGEAIALLPDTTRLGSAAQIGLAARWQAGGPAGQFYFLDLTNKTASGSILDVSLYRVTSGPVWSLLSKSSVASGTYFTSVTSPTTVTLRLESYTLTAMLGNSAHVTAVDSWLTGAGQAGFGVRSGWASEVGYAAEVLALTPRAYWRLGEASGVNTATDQQNSWHGVYKQASGGVTGLLTGDLNTAATFDGTSGHIEVNCGFNVNSAMTLVALVNVKSQGAVVLHTIVSKWDAGTDPPFKFLVGNFFQVQLVGPAGNDSVTATGVTTITRGADYFVGVTFNVRSAKVELWVNNSVEAVSSWGRNVEVDSAVPVMIGRQFGGDPNYFRGTIDEVAIWDQSISSAQMTQLYATSVASPSTLRERWDNFVWGPMSAQATEVNSPLLVRGLVDGWSARVYDPTSVALGSAVASLGTAAITLTTSAWGQPIYGALQVFQDQSYTAAAPYGRFPTTANSLTARGGDIYLYGRGYLPVTNVQTTLPHYNPRGGFANVGSLRLRAEQLGYSTFTDSQFTGVTRGAGGTTAASHSNAVSLGAFVVTTGPVGSSTLLTLTAAATDPLSNMGLFTSNSAYLYFGASSRFTRIGVALAQNASAPLSLGYEYSTGDGTWASQTASGMLPVVDTTSGFSRSPGHLWIEPQGDWAPTNRVTSGGTALADSTSRYYLRVLRSNSVATTPVEMQVLLDGDLVVAGRVGAAYRYPTVLADSGAVLNFKAIATGVRGQMADGTKSPITAVWS